MPLNLYVMEGSPPCRTVLLALKALGVELNIKYLSYEKKEHLSPEFIKINPQHTVPVLDDNGFYLSESRAIIAYLANKYGKDESLYPKDPKKRALVDQRLYFDIDTLYARFSQYYSPVYYGTGSFDPTKYKKMEEAIQYVDLFLENSEFITGDNLTLADVAIVVTVSTYEVMDFNFAPYKNVRRWLAKVKASIPCYEEISAKDLAIVKGYLPSK